MSKLRTRRWRWGALSAIVSIAVWMFTLIPFSSQAQLLVNDPPARTATTFLAADATILDPICDVYPNSPYYADLVSLVERYGIDISFSDGTCRLDQPLIRGDFVLYLNQALDRIVELVEAATTSPSSNF